LTLSSFCFRQVGPKTFGVRGPEFDLSSLPKVNEGQHLNRILIHSRSAEFVGMRQSDMTSLDGLGCRRSTSGTTQSMSSARRKLRNSLPLTRSFANTNLSGVDQTLLASPRCSSLPGAVGNMGTISSMPMSLVTMGYSSSMISDDFELLNLNSANMNMNHGPVSYPLETDPRSSIGVRVAQSGPQSVFNMRSMPAAEAVNRLKLIPIATPGDDKTLHTLNKVSASFKLLSRFFK